MATSRDSFKFLFFSVNPLCILYISLLPLICTFEQCGDVIEKPVILLSHSCVYMCRRERFGIYVTAVTWLKWQKSSAQVLEKLCGKLIFKAQITHLESWLKCKFHELFTSHHFYIKCKAPLNRKLIEIKSSRRGAEKCPKLIFIFHSSRRMKTRMWKVRNCK